MHIIIIVILYVQTNNKQYNYKIYSVNFVIISRDDL